MRYFPQCDRILWVPDLPNSARRTDSYNSDSVVLPHGEFCSVAHVSLAKMVKSFNRQAKTPVTSTRRKNWCSRHLLHWNILQNSSSINISILEKIRRSSSQNSTEEIEGDGEAVAQFVAHFKWTYFTTLVRLSPTGNLRRDEGNTNENVTWKYMFALLALAT